MNVFSRLNFQDIINQRMAGMRFIYASYVESGTGTSTAATKNEKIYVLNTSELNRFIYIHESNHRKKHTISSCSSPFKSQSATSISLKRFGDQTGAVGWKIFATLLASQDIEAEWLRTSLMLLCEVCRGRNFYSQHMVSSILPAEMLIDLLDHDGNKHEQ